MEPKNNRVIVVLGMHRSGTSAIARGLEVLGVKLGDNLHPAAIDNPKGFWEDRSVLSVNEELLAYLGSAYDRVGLINWDIQDVPEIDSIRRKAERIVREKCDQNILWGFKDPRTARLLSFWQAVFKKVGCDVAYVVATRNPISIVESLRKRNGFAPIKTFYLWLEHLVPAIIKTRGAKRVVVDYDQLLENPSAALSRVAQALELPAPDPLALSAYEQQFLERGLRHTLYTAQDLENYPSVPSQVITGYDWLVNLACDNVALDSIEVDRAFEALSQELVALSPALKYIAHEEGRLVAVSQVNAENEQTIVSLRAQLNDRLAGNEWLTSQRDAWEKLATERERSIAALQMQVQDLHTANTWQASQRDAWERTAAERDQSIATLQTQVQDLLTGNAWLTSQRDAWAMASDESDKQAKRLAKELGEREDLLNRVRSNRCVKFINLFLKRKFF